MTGHLAKLWNEFLFLVRGEEAKHFALQAAFNYIARVCSEPGEHHIAGQAPERFA